MNYRYTYYVSRMDCPCEEQLIRMRLQGLPIQRLSCDMGERLLRIDASSSIKQEIDFRLQSLDLGVHYRGELTIESDDISVAESTAEEERRVLIYVLVINFVLFLLEVLIGYIAESMGVLADSLDMLADAFIYGLSLSVVSLGVVRQRRVARLSGGVQMALAFLGLFEVARRFLSSDVEPNSWLMVGVSVIALVANLLSLRLLNGLRAEGSHIAASRIFSANDVLINVGVILSALLVYLLDSPYPDWVVGVVTFTLVLRGACQILKLSRV